MPISTEISSTVKVTGGGGSYLTATAVQTGNYNAVAGDLVRCDTSGGAFNVTLPAAPLDGDRIGIMDVAIGGSFETAFPLTVLRNGRLIDSVADDFNLDVDKMAVEFLYDSTNNNWVVYENPQGGATGGGGTGVTGTPTRVGAVEIDGVINLINTNIGLYTVPGATYPAATIVKICNRNNAVIAVRLAHIDGALGALANEDYLVYDTQLQPYETKYLTIDGLEPTDTLMCRSDTVDVNFMVTALIPLTDLGYKRIAATTVVAATDTSLITAAAEYEYCSLIVCNKDNTNSATIRTALIDGALGALADEDYMAYEETILANETKVFSETFHLPNTYTVMVRASDSDVNFILYGRERV